MSRGLTVALLGLLVGGAYARWLLPGVITYGDWGYFPANRMLEFFPFPSFWEGSTGLGAVSALAAPSFPLLAAAGGLAHLGVSFAVIERLLWYLPFAILAPVGSYYFLRYLFGDRMVATVGALFYSLNTYTVMAAAGGQLTLGMAYVLLPLVCWLVFRALDQDRWSPRLLAGLSVSALMMYDLRVAYLALGVVVSYVVLKLVYDRQATLRHQLRGAALSGVTIALVAVSLHLWWVIPGIISLQTAPTLPSGYDNPGWVIALSYMTPSHALTLYHPLWQSLTQVNFVPFYLLVWPVMAFAAALFARHWRVLWLLIVAMVSIFLVKGSNAPFGAIYLWLFENLPGFEGFRDPSKFFIPAVLAYAGLIGVTVRGLTDQLAAVRWAKGRGYVRWAPLSLVVFLLVLTIWPAYTGTLGQSFRPQPVPEPYEHFTTMLDQEPEFFRTLWVPIAQRFAPYDANHPAISAVTAADRELKPFETDPSRIASFLEHPHAEELLASLAVKYVVVPTDTNDDIFRHYEPRERFIARLDALPFLRPVASPESLRIYQTRRHVSHIYASGNATYLPGSRGLGTHAALASVLSPEGDRYPTVLSPTDNPVTLPDASGGQAIDVARGEQRDGELSIPFVVRFPSRYEIYARLAGQAEYVEGARVVDDRGYTVSEITTPGRTRDPFTGLPVPASSKDESLLVSSFTTLGTVSLTPGSYRLIITDSDIVGGNLVNNPSFEGSLPLGAQASLDRSDGRQSLKVVGGQVSGDFYVSVRGLDPTLNYRITFDYKHVAVGAPMYGIEHEETGVLPITPLPVVTEWQRHTTTVKPLLDATGLRIHFYSRGNEREPATNLYDNLKVTQSGPVESIVMRAVSDEPPKVTFERKSATHYRASVENAREPFHLVFAERYHPEWRITTQDGKSLSAKHLEANGYANAWWIDRPGTYEVDIRFVPRRLAAWGAAASALALLAILTIIVANTRRGS